mgnify:CR=1 FL=1
MRLSQLETLVSVAELGSLSRAAERLHIAQPALSRQVRMLEQELGVPLFDRHGRGMVLTEFGQEVLRRAYRVLGELDELRNSVSDVGGLRGHVSVGIPPTVADLVTLPLAAEMAERHPDATLRVVSAYSRFLLDWLRRGDIDLAILYASAPVPTVRTTPLLDEELHLVGPAAAGLQIDRPVALADLAGVRMLLPSRGHGLRSLVDALAAQAGFEFAVRVEADGYSTLKDLVLAGHGLTILPLAPIHSEISGTQLSYTRIVDPTPVRRLVLAIGADRTVTRLTAFAIEQLVGAIHRLTASGSWPGTTLDGDPMALMSLGATRAAQR